MKFLMGFTIGWLLSFPVGMYFANQNKLPPEQEYAAYHHCMQQAGSLGCRMTPQDFVRYYQLKDQLEAAK